VFSGPRLWNALVTKFAVPYNISVWATYRIDAGGGEIL
jgi:hypothetical protein